MPNTIDLSPFKAGSATFSGSAPLALTINGLAANAPTYVEFQVRPTNPARLRGDITDRDSLVRGMEGCSQVYHLAAYAKNWARDPRTFDEMNIQGMRNVFDAAARQGVQRVVWTSTMLTFGPTPRGGRPQSMVAKTSPPDRPAPVTRNRRPR